MTDRTLRIAGVCSLLAIPALLLSAIFLALFFGGAGWQFGPLNDFFVAVMTGLLILPARSLLEVVVGGGRPDRRWFQIVTWVAIAGLVIMTVGQMLLVVGLISLDASFVTGSLGVVPVLVWAAAQVYLALRFRTPSRIVGWTLIAVLTTAGFLTAASAVQSSVATWSLTIAVVVALVGYFAVLGRELLRYAEGGKVFERRARTSGG